MPKISICIPTYKPLPDLIKRCLDSIAIQTFKDYEIVQMEDEKGNGMAWNTNRVIEHAKGELIKILYQDDWLMHNDVLQMIVDNFEGQWMILGSNNNENPRYSNVNTLGSPSALVIKNENPQLFNENLKWTLDLDYYKRMYGKFGLPKIIFGSHIGIGQGPWQETNKLSDEIKRKEENDTSLTS